MAPSSLFR